MDILFNNMWVMFIVVTMINGFVLKYRSKKYILQNPDLEEGYNKLFKGWIIYGNIPWLIIALGNLSGMTNSIFDYFNPKSMNPIVLLFHASIIVIWILSVRWIYFKEGAEFMERHPGLLQKSSLSGNSEITAKQIKIFLPLMLLGGIAGMVMMWIMDIPSPQF